MWVSKKKWIALEKRIADLEGQVQNQLDVKIDLKVIRESLRKFEARHGTDVKASQSLTSY